MRYSGIIFAPDIIVKKISLIILVFSFLQSTAQTVADSLHHDSIVKNHLPSDSSSAGDSIFSVSNDTTALVSVSTDQQDAVILQSLKQSINTPFPFSKPAQTQEEGNLYAPSDKDWMFYLLSGLLFLLGCLRLIFPRYFSDLFRLFFNTTLKQVQVRERLLQSDLPSLLLNIFFILSGGFYLYQVISYYGVHSHHSHWMVLSVAMLVLMVIYLVKFVGLKFSGWLFGMEEATDLYIFIVSLFNKLLGISLLPLIILMAYSPLGFLQTLMAISFLLIAIFFGVRFIRAYGSLRYQLKISFFHFFLYLLCFEVIPLLIIYRTLMLYFQRSA